MSFCYFTSTSMPYLIMKKDCSFSLMNCVMTSISSVCIDGWKSFNFVLTNVWQGNDFVILCKPNNSKETWFSYTDCIWTVANTRRKKLFIMLIIIQGKLLLRASRCCIYLFSHFIFNISSTNIIGVFYLDVFFLLSF